MKTYSPETHDRLVREMHDRLGLKAYEIGYRLGVPTDPVREAKKRMGLVEHIRLPRPVKADREPAPPRQRQNPLAFAKTWLMGRFNEKPTGFWLDGVPVNLDTLMQAANSEAKANGAEQLGYNPKWLV